MASIFIWLNPIPPKLSPRPQVFPIRNSEFRIQPALLTSASSGIKRANQCYSSGIYEAGEFSVSTLVYERHVCSCHAMPMPFPCHSMPMAFRARSDSTPSNSTSIIASSQSTVQFLPLPIPSFLRLNIFLLPPFPARTPVLSCFEFRALSRAQLMHLHPLLILTSHLGCIHRPAARNKAPGSSLLPSRPLKNTRRILALPLVGVLEGPRTAAASLTCPLTLLQAMWASCLRVQQFSASTHQYLHIFSLACS